MRYAICALTILVCLAATAGIAYLHGFDRALGVEEWRFESRLMGVYVGEIPLHAGPLGILALASMLSARSVRAQRLVLVATVVVAGLALYETREAVRAYILTTPGQFIASPSWCNVLLGALWLGAISVLAAVLFGVRKNG